VRTSTIRLLACAASAAMVGLAAQAGAAAAVPGPKSLSFTDPAGDDKIGASSDIVKVTYATQGLTSKVGKKTVYTPKRLVMTIETAGDISSNGTVQYDIEGNLPGCGDFYLYASPGAVLEFLASSCGDDDTVEFDGSSFEVKGKTITFVVPLGSIPGATVGKSVTALHAYTGLVDPVTGEVGPVLIGSNPLENDGASSDASYKIG
jgi:hypothetical protein